MSVKKFKLDLDRWDQYEIHIDPEVWHEKRIKHFNDFLVNKNPIHKPVTTVKEVAQHLAALISDGYKPGKELLYFGCIKTYDTEGSIIYYDTFCSAGISLKMAYYSKVWTTNEINEQQNISNEHI